MYEAVSRFGDGNDMSNDQPRQRCQSARDRVRGDFARLFDQLERPDAAASIDGGLMQLMTRINDPARRRTYKPPLP